RPAASEDLVGQLDRFQRIVEFPPPVRRIEVMGGDENVEAVLLRRLENSLHVLDGPVLPDALADRRPRGTPLTQDIDLRGGEDHRRVDTIEHRSEARGTLRDHLLGLHGGPSSHAWEVSGSLTPG